HVTGVQTCALPILVQSIKGIVVGEEGAPLHGASITIKGTSVGTLTDAKGEFAFPDLETGTVLIVTYTGYIPKEVVIQDQTIRVELEVDPASLDEVVVVAFGTQKKTDLVGAVT